MKCKPLACKMACCVLPFVPCILISTFWVIYIHLTAAGSHYPTIKFHSSEVIIDSWDFFSLDAEHVWQTLGKLSRYWFTILYVPRKFVVSSALTSDKKYYCMISVCKSAHEKKSGVPIMIHQCQVVGVVTLGYFTGQITIFLMQTIKCLVSKILRNYYMCALIYTICFSFRWAEAYCHWANPSKFNCNRV